MQGPDPESGPILQQVETSEIPPGAARTASGSTCMPNAPKASHVGGRAGE